MNKIKNISAFDYAIVVKKHLDFMVITIPDLNISVIEDLPKNGKITDQFLLKIMSAMAQCWKKAHTQMTQKHEFLPPPSLIKNVVQQRTDATTQMEMTAPEAAAFLGCAENTIRRAIQSGKIKCRTSPGGHRRILREELVIYQESLIKTSPPNDS